MESKYQLLSRAKRSQTQALSKNKKNAEPSGAKNSRSKILDGGSYTPKKKLAKTNGVAASTSSLNVKKLALLNKEEEQREKFRRIAFNPYEELTGEVEAGEGQEDTVQQS